MEPNRSAIPKLSRFFGAIARNSMLRERGGAIGGSIRLIDIKEKVAPETQLFIAVETRFALSLATNHNQVNARVLGKRDHEN